MVSSRYFLERFVGVEGDRVAAEDGVALTGRRQTDRGGLSVSLASVSQNCLSKEENAKTLTDRREIDRR